VSDHVSTTGETDSVRGARSQRGRRVASDWELGL